MINSINQALDKTFPESLSQTIQMSDIEKKVHDYTGTLIIKGCEYWEKTAEKLSKVRAMYRAAWIPYYMLKSPFAFRHKLCENSTDNNLTTLTNINAANAVYCCMTPNVCRLVPITALFRIKKGTEHITQFASTALMTMTFVYSPVIRTWSCLKNSSGMKTMDFDTLQTDAGYCLNKASHIYQGPEALLGVMTTLTTGILLKIISNTIFSILLSDTKRTERYETLDRLYTAVVMLLKEQWDNASAANDTEKQHQCMEQAKKLSTNVPLIKETLSFYSVLTDPQVANIISKLSWGCQYVLQHQQPVNQSDTQTTTTKEPKTETPKQEANQKEANPLSL